MGNATEALKLAIQLKDTASGYWTENEIPIIEKLIELLAQPEQEPVAWMDIDEKGAASGLRYWHEPENRHEVPLYTTPPQRTWVGLTDDDICMFSMWLDDKSDVAVFTAIEDRLKELNT